MTTRQLQLIILPDTFAICRMDPGSAAPRWLAGGSFSSVTWTADETSIICAEADVPAAVTCERGWRCLQVKGPLDFALTGVLASVMAPLARGDISGFAVSTYDTDYLLVKHVDVERAIAVLREAGHAIG